jgi:cation diffusion facilitator family transporter
MIKEKFRVAFVSMLAAIVLTATKTIVGLLTGSLGLLSEALHSGLDLVAAIITLFSVSVSDKPADEHHHYGHGKVENVSALAETILLFITCGWIIYEAISRLVSGNTHIEVNIWSYIVISLSIVIDITRSRALSKTAKKYNSQALEADALHFSTDIWSSLVVLIGLICANFGIYLADSIAALMVALIVIYVSYQLGSRSIAVLLDRTSKEKYQLILSIIDNFDEIKAHNSLKLRTSGADTFIEVNIHVESGIPIDTAHEISHRLESEIQQAVERSFVHVHVEPSKRNII